ncbi:beta-galactosidase [Thermococcus sp.]|uniref:glycoside hydrolase 5 family protein n=1 Tax=Thermococcus sp. TaxID=35749 RepID=UPI0025EB34F6|nr:beta-galactosidase [Thermococcus sp.]
MEFVLGVNYWPRRKAMFWWKEFEEDEVREEFTVIKELNLDVVRIFLLWEDFQPEPERVDEKSLRNLERVMDIAHELGLGVMPTFFIGHMSGINWLPEWTLSETPHPRFLTYSNGRVVDLGARDIYEEPDLLKAEELLLRTVGSELDDHPALYAWDISNEIDNVRIPRTPWAGKRWVRFVYETLKASSSKPVTFGIHQEDIQGDKHFRVGDVAEGNDFLCMHAYSVYTDFTDPLDPYFVPFACLLTRALGGKEVLMEEFGMPTTPEETRKVRSVTGKHEAEHYLINEGDAARWLEETLKALYEFGTLGAFYWNFADYHESVWDRPPLDRAVHERFFGLLRSDGSLKPTALVIREFRKKMGELKRRNVEIDVPEDYYSDPKGNLVRLYREFRKKLGLE